MSSDNSQEDLLTEKIQAEVVKALSQKQGLEVMSGALGVAALDASRRRDNLNISAEDAAARKAAGWPEVEVEDNPMHVGDINHPPQAPQVIIVPQPTTASPPVATTVATPVSAPPSKGLNPIAALALGLGLGPVGVLAGQYLMSDAPKPEPVQKVINAANDPGETIKLGLMKIEDLE